MGSTVLEEAIGLLEKANAGLEPELMSSGDARAALALYARAENLAAYGKTALARKVADPIELARMTGSSVGKARDTVATAGVLSTSGQLDHALRSGAISVDQASEIARAEASAPGVAEELIAVANEEPFHVLRDKARKTALEAEQHRGLGARQHTSRTGRSYSDGLGMTHIHLTFEPHIGTPIVSQAEAEATRLSRAARSKGTPEPFERHLADAYAKMLAGGPVKGPAKRPELVVVVSHEVITRGWRDVRSGELCKIPGVGPVAPEVAREIARDAFLSGVLYDGKDLRNFNRWTRHIPIEVQIALELGAPPGFDGVVCVDCGNHFRTEFDHVEPRVRGGPSSNRNVEPRCGGCHKAKTLRDRKAGKLTPPEP
ncbi:MAG: HNH endonuclease [Actinomycetota bacterium]|nr:HNH endonuclease [Actinomycetota bacterium]